ncbi:MAG TPA: PPOX class F420-dependent oxidoreductase [Gaiellaceae bacterium]|jgi:PPOX class probable F420-dependent enzyme|nr:PPOX class F420-dependent oxidoreductase [Gaiellaceae bacterium]
MEKTATLPDSAVKLLLGRNWGNLVDLRPDGSPHVTPVWVDYDGEHVLVNSAYGRCKVRNIARDPRVAVDVLPAADQQSGYVSVSGTAELVDDGADEHIDTLAKKYLGLDEYPFRSPGEQRVIIRITPERVDTHGVAE